MTETRLREEICRLGRSLFERGLTPGSSGNISVRLDDGGWLVTPTNASLGSLDPARLSRLDADGKLVSGDAPTKEVPLHTALYQTRGSGARGGASAFDPFGGAVDAAGDRSARRAAADDGLLPDEMRRHRAGAVLSARRSRRRRRDQGSRREIFLGAARQSRPGGRPATRWRAAVFAIEELEETAKLYLLLRGLNPRYLTPAQVADLSKTFGLALPEHRAAPTPSSGHAEHVARTMVTGACHLRTRPRLPG